MTPADTEALVRHYLGFPYPQTGPDAKPVPPVLFCIAKDSRDHSPEVYREVVLPMFATLDPELSGAIVSAYNDFQSSFAEEGDGRFVPLTILPYWDRDAAVFELERCAAMGHKGVVLGLDYPRVGVPPLRDEYWDPVLSAAQRLGLPGDAQVQHPDLARRGREQAAEHADGRGLARAVRP